MYCSGLFSVTFLEIAHEMHILLMLDLGRHGEPLGPSIETLERKNNGHIFRTVSTSCYSYSKPCLGLFLLCG